MSLNLHYRCATRGPAAIRFGFRITPLSMSFVDVLPEACRVWDLDDGYRSV